MKKYFLTLFLGIFSIGVLQAQVANFFTRADAFLKKNVTSGSVDYAGIKAAPAELNALVTEIGSFDLNTVSKSGQKAFWLNTYNILVIKNVIDHYPIAKPLDVPGFFDAIRFTAAGSSITLSDIENKKIRPVYQDARIHFALVCAAKSCPPLPNYAFTADKVETQLETLTKAAMNNPNFIKVDDNAKTVQFSMILDWYKDDFFTVSKTQLEYVNKYRTTQIPTNYKQSFYTYNWSLNIKK